MTRRRLEAQLANGPLQLADRRHGPFEIDGGHAHQPRGMVADEGGHVVVRGHGHAGPRPGGDQQLLDARGIHRRHQLVGRHAGFQPPARAGQLGQPPRFRQMGSHLRQRWIGPGVDDGDALGARHGWLRVRLPRVNCPTARSPESTPGLPSPLAGEGPVASATRVRGCPIAGFSALTGAPPHPAALALRRPLSRGEREHGNGGCGIERVDVVWRVRPRPP